MVANVYRFGSFVLDPARRILFRDDVPTTLAPKAFDVLVYLLEHRDRAVGRDELIAAVWGKVEITDNALGQVVLQARRALEDSGPDGQRIVRTVPRFGYRWAAEVQEIDAGEVPTGDGNPDEGATVLPEPSIEEPPPSSLAERRSRPRWPWLIGACVALGVVLAAAIWIDRRSPDEARTMTLRTPAFAVVLPVAVDAPPAFGWLRLGAMDLIAQRLRRAGQVVAPSDNVVGLAQRFSTTDGGTDIAALKRAAGTTDVVEANARLEGGRWKFVLRLPARGAEVSGEDVDAIVAARIASDRMAQAIGLRVPPEVSGHADAAAVLQHVRAAILSEQLEDARALLAQASDADRSRPEFRYHFAEIDFRSGRLDAAEKEFRSLLAGKPAPDEVGLHGRVLNALANIAYLRADFAQVEALSDRALSERGIRDDANEMGRAWTGRASARAAQQRYDDAVADFAQARVAFEAAGNRLALARVDAYLGLLEINRDRVAEALPLLRGAAERLQAFDAVVEELHARVGVVMAELSLLDPAAAVAQCARLRELASRTSDPRRKNYMALACAEALLVNGRYREAGLLMGEVVKRSQPPEETLLRQSRIQVYRVAAELAFASGDASTALDEAAAGLALPAEFGPAGARVRLMFLQALAYIASGDEPAASRAVSSARQLAGGDQKTDMAVYAALAAGVLAAERHERGVAEAAFEQALAVADASRMPSDTLVVVQNYGEYLLKTGNLDRAGQVIGRVGPWATGNYAAALLQVRLYRALGQSVPWEAALHKARELAGERVIPAQLRQLPTGSSNANQVLH